MIRLLSVLVAIVLFFIWLAPDNHTSIEHTPRVLPIAASLATPIQKEAQNTQPFQIKEYTLQPKAEIHLAARLLGKERYRLGRESDLSPMDLALGWGAMANPQVTEQIQISQSGRWFHWKTDKLPIPRREIERNAANMHIIPANQTVEKQLSRIEEGDIIQLSGQLVDIQSQDGYFWRTSMSREDIGAGACEIIYTTQLDIVPASSYN
ncbi:hypothetical protein [Neptunomonas sp.]|uniref:hypothetical protein n=1 Tax=Neptunomonas sp. TaxID=1971898 RepID=UPI003562ED05